MKVKYFFIGLLVLICIIALAFTLELGSLSWKRFFAPRHENVKREVFLNTRSYNEAKLQELLKMRKEYLLAKDETEKEVLASTIRHTFAEYDESKLPEDLRRFLYQIKY
jgi:hypothetical protein